MRDKMKSGLKVAHDGDTWRILGTGVVREDGKTYCHLSSETRGRQQKNGWVPVQIADWIDLADARMTAIPSPATTRIAPIAANPPLEAHR